MKYLSAITEERLQRAIEKVAVYAANDTGFLPVFEKLEQELDEFRSRQGALERARKLANQSATRSNRSAANFSSAPLP